MAKILFWDIEAGDLDADIGTMLCFGYKWQGEKEPHVISVLDSPRTFKEDPTNDYYVAKRAGEILSQADLWVFHYGEFYDVPFVRTRLMEHGLPNLPKTRFVDTWRIARKRLKLRSNSLASLTDFLDLEKKTPLTKRIWRRARAGHAPSVKYVIEHCKQDVIVEEQAYNKLAPIWDQHPNVSIIKAGVESCPGCGSFEYQKRGYERAAVKVYPRLHCQKCGKWFRGEAVKGLIKGVYAPKIGHE